MTTPGKSTSGRPLRRHVFVDPPFDVFAVEVDAAAPVDPGGGGVGEELAVTHQRLAVGEREQLSPAVVAHHADVDLDLRRPADGDPAAAVATTGHARNVDLASTVAGVDAVYGEGTAFGACVVIDNQLNTVESSTVESDAGFPYIPGYLMYREAPAIEAALKQASRFDCLMVNGHGVAHPRGCGLATYMGLIMETPSIGVARDLLVGETVASAGDVRQVVYQGRVVAAEILREGHRPVYVSVGHMVSLDTAVEVVRGMTTDGFLPEPLRRAHILATEMRSRARPEVLKPSSEPLPE